MIFFFALQPRATARISVSATPSLAEPATCAWTCAAVHRGRTLASASRTRGFIASLLLLGNGHRRLDSSQPGTPPVGVGAGHRYPQARLPGVGTIPHGRAGPAAPDPGA